MLRPLSVIERIAKQRAFPQSIIAGPEEFDSTVDHTAIAGFAPAAPFITQATKIVTMGSCFAGNIARNLKNRGYEIFSLDVHERLFNPFALQQFVEGLTGKELDLP